MAYALAAQEMKEVNMLMVCRELKKLESAVDMKLILPVKRLCSIDGKVFSNVYPGNPVTKAEACVTLCLIKTNGRLLDIKLFQIAVC